MIQQRDSLNQVAGTRVCKMSCLESTRASIASGNEDISFGESKNEEDKLFPSVNQRLGKNTLQL